MKHIRLQNIAVFTIIFVILFFHTPPAHATFSTSTTLSNLFIGYDDWTPPITTLSLLHNNTSFTPTERVTNRSFADELQGWTTTGTVTTQHDTAVLGDQHAFGTHRIEQTLQGPGTLTLTYHIFGQHPQPLLPVFIITQNNVPRIRSFDTTGASHTAIIPLLHGVNTIAITLESHPLLSSQPLWVEVSHITTTTLAVGKNDELALQSSEQGEIWYTLDSITQRYIQPFTPSQHTGTLAYWSADTHKNKEIPLSSSYIKETDLDVAPHATQEHWSPTLSSLKVPERDACPTTYIDQNTKQAASFSPLPFLDHYERAFTSNTSLFDASNCFQTTSQGETP